MAVICPTVTEYDLHAYRERMEQLEKFAERVHIDLMDGQLAPTVSPPLSAIWLPKAAIADIHLMYQNPANQLDQLIRLKPSLVVIHAEANVDHAAFAAALKAAGIKAGLALLQDTTVESVSGRLEAFDHALVFSGDLGKHQGKADLGLLDKVRDIRGRFPGIEIGWDGGVNDQNAAQLVEAGVDVLNAGGFIAGAAEPEEAYAKLKSAIKQG